jgi:hypothetical protein
MSPHIIKHMFLGRWRHRVELWSPGQLPQLLAEDLSYVDALDLLVRWKVRHSMKVRSSSCQACPAPAQAPSG